MVVKTDTDRARGSAPVSGNDEAKSDDPLSAALESDPLSGALASDDPLSGALASAGDPLSGGGGGGGGGGGKGGNGNYDEMLACIPEAQLAFVKGF